MSTTPNGTPILDALDPEIVDTLVTRRDALRTVGASGLVAAGLAAGSAPLALGALASSAYAQTVAPSQIVAVLRFALLLENLENEFYRAVLGTSQVAAVNAAFAPVRGTFAAGELAAFQEIQRHEQAHVNLLRTAIQGLGGTADTYTASSFDFTGGRGSGSGPLVTATQANGKALLLAATQAFEDTGVRAYKGQAGNLLRTEVLTTALQIHSIEARHAAKIRRMRAEFGADANVVRRSGVIVGGGLAAAGAPAGAPAAVADLLALVYGGATPESNTQHTVVANGTPRTLDAATVPGSTTQFAQMAYDEPLTAAEVVAIVTPFIAQGTPLPPLPPG